MFTIGSEKIKIEQIWLDVIAGGVFSNRQK